MTTTETTTCGRMIAALDHEDRRSLRPCAKVTGHAGHCHYAPAAEVRPTEAVCPPWCSGHDGDYQAWEDTGSDSLRNHMDRVRYVSGVGVSVGRTEHSHGALSAPFVEVYSDDATDLTPTEARELARQRLPREKSGPY